MFAGEYDFPIRKSERSIERDIMRRIKTAFHFALRHEMQLVKTRLIKFCKILF